MDKQELTECEANEAEYVEINGQLYHANINPDGSIEVGEKVTA